MATPNATLSVNPRGGGTWQRLIRGIPGRARQGLLLVAAFSLASSILQLALPLYSMQVFDRVLASGSNPTLVALTIIAVVFVVAGTLLDALRAQMLVRLGNILELHWREPLLKAAFHPTQPWPIGLGSLRDLEIVKNCVTGPGLAALLDLPWTSFFVLAVFSLAPPLGCVTVAAIGFLLATAVVGEALSGRWGREGQAVMGEAQRVLEASLAGRDAVLSMGAEARVRRRVAALRDRAIASGSRSLDRSAWSTATASGFRSLCQVTVLMAAASLVLSERIPAGAIVAGSMLFTRALGPVERVAAAYRQLRAAREALLRLIALEEGEMAADRGKVLSLPSLVGQVKVTGLTAKRSPTAATVLENVSFDVPGGEIVAVVGDSGAGKSTLMRSLVGVTKPTAGTVRLDGAAVTDWNPDQLGPQLGYLPQEPQLLDGTVAEVIARFGPIDDAKVVAAAQRVGAHDLFLRLPRGYQTVVGRLDHALSPGERQRVALARAFYDDPALLVLDDPTANLDDKGEKQVFSAVLSAKERGATVIMVSRLMGLLKMADHLLMLERGRVKIFAPRAQLEQYLVPRFVANGSDFDRQVRHANQG